MNSTTGQATIEMKNITVEFPGVIAVKDVDCSIKPGEVLALVGANGAGKSSLMKVLSGVYSHYTGDIFIDGKPVEIRSPGIAKKYGIEIVYQEVDSALVPNLSVAENVMMDSLVFGKENNAVIKWGFLRKETAKVLTRLNMPINPRTLVSELSLAQKQMVIIARAMMGNCRYLLLDEPTAPLSMPETQKLFELVLKLKNDGVAVIFISHRLNELFEICDRITVLRDGSVTGNQVLDAKTTIPNIVEMMLGSADAEEVDVSGRIVGDDILQVAELSDKDQTVSDVDLHVRKGEIVGVFGLVGAGKSELCKTIFGANKKRKGTIKLNGKTFTGNSPAASVKAGIAFIPEERRKEGFVLDDPVYSNLSLVTLPKHLTKIAKTSQ